MSSSERDTRDQIPSDKMKIKLKERQKNKIKYLEKEGIKML
ncbi:MAG TPA: hypothetical protein VE089_11570 [Nitrososphaeraceae archaeon]|nr:hypothetical protein [Nitrososphaeraceae archaeon]